MIKNLLQEGFALKNKGHYKHAIEVFYKILEIDNTSSELLLEIADLYYKMKNDERALSYIEQILNNTPDHIEALKLLKTIFIDKKAYAEAEQTAKNIYCCSHADNDLAELLQILNMQGKFDEVFEYKTNSQNPQIFLEQARACFCNRDFEKTKEILENALSLNPDNQDILLLLGQTYYAQGKKDLASEIALKLTCDENNAEVLNFIGLIEEYKGNLKNACQYIQKAIKLDSNNDKFYYNLANLYFKQHDTVYAKNYYNLAISLNPQNPNYHFALANLYYTQKQYKRALEELPHSLFEANILKVVILYDTGYFALAKQEIKKLLTEYPDNNILLEYSEKINQELGFK